MDQATAREALTGIGAAEARLARAMHCPPWRHAAFGGIMGAFVGGAALPVQWQMFVMAAALAATLALALHDRRRMGVFVNGYRKGRTRAVALALLGGLMALLFAELHLRFNGGSTGSRVAIAVIAGGLATAASVVWQRAYVRELTR